MRHCRFLPALALASFCACTRITIDPQCPDEIEIGATGQLLAREANPGGIPTYSWKASPARSVRIADSDAADTSFEALAEGDVIFTLTAADGLFQMIDSCSTRIVSAEPEPEIDLSVALVANPTTVEIGGEDPSTLLTCTRTGDTPVATFVIDQTEGPTAVLTGALPGIAVAVMPSEPDIYVFRCIGTDADGNDSEPATVTVTVVRETRPPPR